MSGKPLAVYLHVPFCAEKCTYCDFLSFSGSPEVVRQYLCALVREVELVRPLLESRDIATVYFGGGTPSLLPLETLAELLHRILPDPSDEVEVTLEANPGTVSLNSLSSLRRSGFNRLSFGVQSLRSGELKLLGRIHNAAQAKEAVRQARQAGFSNLSLDFLFGLPGQSRGDLVLTLMEALSLEPSHLSLYALTLEKGTPLARAVAEGRLSLPSDDEMADTYQAAAELLEGDGFERYEISNFAKGEPPSPFRSRHNQVYWHYGEYLGLGLGAVSFLEGTRRRNTNSLEEYAAAMGTDLKSVPIAAALTASHTGKRGMAALREEAILHLRTSDGFAEADLAARYPKAFPRFRERLERLYQEGLIWHDGGRWRLPPALFFVSNQIFVRLL
ncbi:MAG: radical SAM family heme chaperone HemW [Coprothermobacterota bacterium]|nr:radical SAM family heme chaperone HemW [Coprothermobacterota bacterium]